MATTDSPPDPQPAVPERDRDAVRTEADTTTTGTPTPRGDTSDGAQRPEMSSDDERERDESGRLLSKEAAGYRRRLRDAEQERDQLRERLDAVHTAEVERLASGAGLAVPGDVWLHGANLETLRGEDGQIDPDVVGGMVGDLLKGRPGLRAPVAGDIGIGRGGAAGGRRPEPVGLSALLKPGHG